MTAKPAVLACGDARFSVHRLLGLGEGDAHVRNAGSAVTEDAIRSLTVSRHLLGTREIVLVHHRDCGMRTFTDPAQDVRQCIGRLRASPFLPHTDVVRGYVLDERTGTLDEVP
ncbi:carbonic anhydrase [Amycolatopsis mongoliensis]|uniref:carbonic anhydrase n=1 Tax=Amycolatopsis mongoliensis TaxID=715475 RepID=A0A9Y2JKZ9_9PSEU|nr:carbonic anhydrase [Amycolatopsis sp. 4-36]WIX99649.1 carbonic anhydrase [Amycolatopsis sp. 4-36]